MTIKGAVLYTLFWVSTAVCFCGWVHYVYGRDHAFMWMSGYMLEWMLSFDNLFVFHLIFSVYATPDHLKHRPLFLGICGAVFFRLAFILVGECLMHAMFLMHFVFGAFLVYTGVKTAALDDEDDDPSQHPTMLWLQTKVPFVSAYDDSGAFFVRVKVDESGKLITPPGKVSAPSSDVSSLSCAEEGKLAQYGSVDLAQTRTGEWRGTMLFLVVCCLEFSDLLFAVDSVSAIVAQVPDLFLAYTSAIFAMLGLRALFFVVDELVKLFTLLKYGVACVLVFIGLKLIIGRIYHIPPAIVCAVLVSAIMGSMLASLITDELRRRASKRLGSMKEGDLVLVPSPRAEDGLK